MTRELNPNDVVIVEAVRTPMARRNGKFKGIHATKLAALVLEEVAKRAGIEKKLVEHVVLGCVSQVGEQGINIARNAALLAGYPITTPGTSVDFQCGSSQQAVHLAAGLIATGTVEIAIAGGVESMSRVPMGSNSGNGKTPPEGPGHAFSELRNSYELIPQGFSAERIAKLWKMTRRDVDAFSAESHKRAHAATVEGRFKSQILPVEYTDDSGEIKVLDYDDGIRPESTVDSLGTLKLAFDQEGVITAANSSQITDGAAAILLMSARKAKELGLKPRARIVAQHLEGSDPTLMLTGPIEGTKNVLKKAGLTIKDIDRFEINEAFAPVVLAWQRELDPDMEKVNVNGGAIAVGHPLGASGARLMTVLLNELERSGGHYGLQTMCCGGGMATNTIIERL
jgi:acetyl-CoA acetyltransferase family protein